MGTIETSRIAAGRKMGLTYEVTGSEGSLYFNQERMSEIQLYTKSDPSNRQGFRTILLGPEHPDYGAFSPAPGHGLGFNDQKIFEARDLIQSILNDDPLWPDFRSAYEVDKVIESVEFSAANGCWVKL